MYATKGKPLVLLSLENPVFRVYAIAAALMGLKIMLQGWMTVFRMIKVKGGYASPEDIRATRLNPDPDPAQLAPNDYVERSRRLHRNDLENIPAFLAVGLLFVTTAPPLWAAVALFFGFVLARLGHFWAYATARTHDTRAKFYTVGSLIVIYMGVHVIWVALTWAATSR